MLKGLGQIASLMKNAQRIESQMQEVQQKLRQVKVSGTAGGGMVTIEMNGQHRVLSCRIDKSLFAANDREMIEDLVVGAINQAVEKVQEAMADQFEEMAGSMGLPAIHEALSHFGIGNVEGS